MRISAMEEYGLRTLLCLARRALSVGDIQAAMTIPEMAREEGISVPYTSKIMRRLRQGGLVNAERGRTGGYHLVREPDKINLCEALETLGGPMMAVDHCERYTGVLDSCVHLSDCSLRGAFGGFTGYLKSALSNTTLADLTEDEAKARTRALNSAGNVLGSDVKPIF